MTNNQRRLPIAKAAEVKERRLSRDELRELSIDTMASWALEGMTPDRQTVSDINALVDGRISREEFRRRSLSAVKIWSK